MDKPKAPLIGANGNVFNLIGITARTFKQNKVDQEIIQEFIDRVYKAQSYDEALMIMWDYVEPVTLEEMEMTHYE